MPAAKNPANRWSEKEWRNALRKSVAKREGKGPQYLERIADRVVQAALNGDMAAAKEIGDRLDGKPAQSIDVAVTDERNVMRAPQPAASAEDWHTTLPKPH